MLWLTWYKRGQCGKLRQLVDKQSGKTAFLGDAKRQILCVGYSEWDENERIASSFEADGESFNDKDIAVYANFIRVYDYFDTWT